MKKQRALVRMAIPLGVLLMLGVALAAERLEFPGDFGGPPFYDNTVFDEDSGWVAILFVRDPDCAGDANLLVLDAAARDCELTSHGFVIRSQPPPNPPDVFHAEGNEDMPVWLLAADDYADAADDGVLTVGELEDIDSLVKGTADKFVVHQYVDQETVITINSNGTLEDGRTFKVKLATASGTSSITVE